MVGKSPYWLQDRLWLIEVAGDRGVYRRVGEERRDAEPEQSGALTGSGHQRMADQIHELLAACLVRGFHQDRPNGVDTESLPVLLLLLDEVVVAAKLLEHVRHDHAATISLVAVVREMMALGTIRKTQREERVGLNRQSLVLVNFLPKELAAHF